MSARTLGCYKQPEPQNLSLSCSVGEWGLLEPAWLGPLLDGAWSLGSSVQIRADLQLGATNCAQGWGKSDMRTQETRSLPPGAFTLHVNQIFKQRNVILQRGYMLWMRNACKPITGKFWPRLERFVGESEAKADGDLALVGLREEFDNLSIDT